MFKKLINAFALTLVLGAFFCACPAFAGGVQDNSHCLNAPNQGSKCDPTYQFPCDFFQAKNANGKLESTAKYCIGPNPKVYDCSNSNLNDMKHCCFVETNCDWYAFYSELGDHTSSYICGKAEQKCQQAMASGQKGLLVTNLTCKSVGNVDGKPCG